MATIHVITISKTLNKEEINKVRTQLPVGINSELALRVLESGRVTFGSNGVSDIIIELVISYSIGDCIMGHNFDTNLGYGSFYYIPHKEMGKAIEVTHLDCYQPTLSKVSYTDESNHTLHWDEIGIDRSLYRKISPKEYKLIDWKKDLRPVAVLTSLKGKSFEGNTETYLIRTFVGSRDNGEGIPLTDYQFRDTTNHTVVFPDGSGCDIPYWMVKEIIRTDGQTDWLLDTLDIV